MSGGDDYVPCTCGTLVRMIESGDPVAVTTRCFNCGGTTREYGVTVNRVIDVNQSVESRSARGGQPHKG